MSIMTSGHSVKTRKDVLDFSQISGNGCCDDVSEVTDREEENDIMA